LANVASITSITNTSLVVLQTFKNKNIISYILIHYVSQSVSDRGFGGWGRERPVK
jgi:hypothetical protein